MTTQQFQLRDFNESELVFSEEETRTILKFFFPQHAAQISSMEIDNRSRSFAQGLLVIGVDASFAMSWLDFTAKWAANPGAGIRQALRKLATKAARNWFKNLGSRSLSDIKIYESIRAKIALSFRTRFEAFTNQANAGGSTLMGKVAFIRYETGTADGRCWG